MMVRKRDYNDPAFSNREPRVKTGTSKMCWNSNLLADATARRELLTNASATTAAPRPLLPQHPAIALAVIDLV